MSNRNDLLGQQLCHYLHEGRTLNDFYFSKPKESFRINDYHCMMSSVIPNCAFMGWLSPNGTTVARNQVSTEGHRVEIRALEVTFAPRCQVICQYAERDKKTLKNIASKISTLRSKIIELSRTKSSTGRHAGHGSDMLG